MQIQTEERKFIVQLNENEIFEIFINSEKVYDATVRKGRIAVITLDMKETTN